MGHTPNLDFRQASFLENCHLTRGFLKFKKKKKIFFFGGGGREGGGCQGSNCICNRQLSPLVSAISGIVIHNVYASTDSK